MCGVPIPVPFGSLKCDSSPTITYAQSHAQVEAFGVEIFNVSTPMTAVMGLDTALMEVMRLDAVS